MADYLKSQDWVADAKVRMREHGHLLFGEAFVVPSNGSDLEDKIAAAVEGIRALDWRIGEVVFTLLPELDRRWGEGPSEHSGSKGEEWQATVRRR